MAFSNPTHLYYLNPTTIPTFSPFYSSTVPPTYPTTISNLTPTPTPNPSFPSYPHHLHDPSYHPPPSFTYPPYSSYPNSTPSPSPNHYTSYTTSSPSDYAYSNHYNYYQHTNLSPPIITHNTTNTLQQQANTIQQPFYHHQPPNTSTPIYHHVDLPSHQNPTPTVPPSFPTHTIHKPPTPTPSPNPDTSQNFMSQWSEISEKYNKSLIEIDEKYKQKEKETQRILKEKLQQLSEKYAILQKSRQEMFLKKRRQEMFLVDTNQEKVEEEEPPEKDGEFIASVEEKEPIVIEEAEKFVTGGSDICFMTDLNLEIIEKENKEEKEQELTQFPPPCPKLPPPQFLSTVSSPALLSPPQGPVPLVEPPSKQLLKSLETNISPASKPPSKLSEPSDQKFPSETFSVPPPASRPPSKPPDPSSSFLISQSHLRTPPCFSKSPLINSLPRPPENLSSLIPASPPPPPPAKPPDLFCYFHAVSAVLSIHLSPTKQIPPIQNCHMSKLFCLLAQQPTNTARDVGGIYVQLLSIIKATSYVQIFYGLLDLGLRVMDKKIIKFIWAASLHIHQIMFLNLEDKVRVNPAAMIED